MSGNTGQLLAMSPEHLLAAVAACPRETLPAVLAAVAARLAETPAQSRKGEDSPPDGLIPVEEAARMAGVTREQFLRRVAFKPAIVKLGYRTTRVNEKRLRRVLAEL